MDAEKFILGEGNIMKKLGISLLVLALVLSFVSANAAIGVRSDLAAGIGGVLSNTTLTYDLNSQIELLAVYGSNAPQVANGTPNKSNTTLGLGVNYWLNKNVGIEGTYKSTVAASNAAAANDAVSSLGLSIVAKVELLKGFNLGWRVPVYTSVSAPTGQEGASSLLINTNTAFVEVDLF